MTDGQLNKDEQQSEVHRRYYEDLAAHEEDTTGLTWFEIWSKLWREYLDE